MKEMLWHKHKWPKEVKKTLKYPEEPLYTILDKAAKESGDRPYTVYSGVSQTFSQVLESANRIANFLNSKGIKKGDRVAIFMLNTPHYPPVFFGILKAGATAVTCNPTYTVPELNFQLKDSGAKMLFVFDFKGFVSRAYAAMKGTDCKHAIVCNIKPFLPKFKAVIGGLLGRTSDKVYDPEISTYYHDIMANYEPKPPKVTIKPKDDLAFILYTGGTTGIPKGAMLTHYNLYSNVMQYDEWVQLEPKEGGPVKKLDCSNEVYIGALPWYHSYGLTLTMIASVYHQSTCVCIADPRDIEGVLKATQNHKGTLLHAVPTLYARMASHPKISKYDLTSLKACGSGAAALAPATAKAFEAASGAILFEGYGLTETSPLASADPTRLSTRKIGSIGFPIPDTDIKILDIETGTKEMKTGEDGELAISGPQVMKGYWKKPDATDEVMRTIGKQRFFLTGDIGHFDKEGYLYITDRKKDLIPVSGFSAYPAEIEEVLIEHPAIQMAAVIGIPRKDEPLNEMVKAYIVLAPGASLTEDELKEWTKERLAGYKRPRIIEFRESLPTSTVGKILRRVLREEELAKK